jgi:hypothetical protein
LSLRVRLKGEIYRLISLPSLAGSLNDKKSAGRHLENRFSNGDRFSTP